MEKNGRKAALKPKFEVEHVGNVAVDSGQVIVDDPNVVGTNED